MFNVYFVNFGYSANQNFDTFEAALQHAKKCGFQATVLRSGHLVASWCPLRGTCHY